MLEFQWNALRIGDHVLVHDDLDPEFAPHAATVRLIQTRSPGANEIAVRLDDQPSETLRPRRQAVHLLPVDGRFECWRCDARSAVATP